MLHPRLHSRHYTTSNLSSKPYVVYRDKVTYSQLRSANQGERHVLLFGSWFDDDASKQVCPTYAVAGLGAAVPGSATGEGYINSTNLASALRARARIHRLAIRVTNTGSTGAGAVPDGKFWIGTLRGTTDRKAFATWTEMSNWLISRNEAVEFSAYSAFRKPVVAVAAPGDFIEYESFNPMGLTMNSFGVADHSLTQIFVVIGSNTNAQTYDIQIDAEWTLEYQSDPVLQSLHSTHLSDAAPDSVWNRAKAFVANAGGVMEDVGIGAAAVAATASLPEAAGAYLGRETFAQGAARFAGRAALRALPR